MKNLFLRSSRARLTSLFVVSGTILGLPVLVRAQVEGALVTNHGATVRGVVQGDMLALDSAANVSLETGASVTGDLVLPADKASVAAAPGKSASAPGNDVAAVAKLKVSATATVTIPDAKAVKGRQRAAKAFSLPAPEPPKAATGTQSVVLQTGREADPDFKKLKDLTLRNPTGGMALPPRTLTLPPGNYRNISVEGGHLLLGVAGSTDRARYSFARLSVSAGASVELLSPVVVVAGQLGPIDGLLGHRRYAQWLDLRVTSGAVAFGPGSEVHGVVTARDSAVTLGRGMKLHGGAVCDQATVETDAQFIGIQPSWSPDASGNAAPLFVHKAARVEQRLVDLAGNWGDYFGLAVTYPDDVPNLALTASTPKITADQQQQVFFEACCVLFDGTGFSAAHLTIAFKGATPSIAVDLTRGQFEAALQTLGRRDPIRDGIRIIRADPALLAAFMTACTNSSAAPRH